MNIAAVIRTISIESHLNMKAFLSLMDFSTKSTHPRSFDYVTKEEADAAVAVAELKFEIWKHKPLENRIEDLDKATHEARNKNDQLSSFIRMEAGKLLT